jgi:hypothetical protein
MSKQPVSFRVRRNKRLKRADKFDANFNVETFERLAKDIQSGRIPRQLNSPMSMTSQGLQAQIQNSGLISYRVIYEVGDGKRGTLTIGHHPEMKLDRARKIADTIQYLADELGIDPQAGLHERLVREIEERGTKWRP